MQANFPPAGDNLLCLQTKLKFSGIYTQVLSQPVFHESGAMEWLFGHRMTPDEMLRKNQRALNKAMRDLDRERLKMEQQEKKVIADIKKLAKEGQMVSCSHTQKWACHFSIPSCSDM